jgi:hypothetical protein
MQHPFIYQSIPNPIDKKSYWDNKLYIVDITCNKSGNMGSHSEAIKTTTFNED